MYTGFQPKLCFLIGTICEDRESTGFRSISLEVFHSWSLPRYHAKIDADLGAGRRFISRHVNCPFVRVGKRITVPHHVNERRLTLLKRWRFIAGSAGVAGGAGLGALPIC
jgi:hypothetical protein